MPPLQLLFEDRKYWDVTYDARSGYVARVRVNLFDGQEETWKLKWSHLHSAEAAAASVDALSWVLRERGFSATLQSSGADAVFDVQQHLAGGAAVLVAMQPAQHDVRWCIEALMHDSHERCWLSMPSWPMLPGAIDVSPLLAAVGTTLRAAEPALCLPDCTQPTFVAALLGEVAFHSAGSDASQLLRLVSCVCSCLAAASGVTLLLRSMLPQLHLALLSQAAQLRSEAESALRVCARAWPDERLAGPERRNGVKAIEPQLRKLALSRADLQLADMLGVALASP